jgi:molybdate transport system regulatory protein
MKEKRDISHQHVTGRVAGRGTEVKSGKSRRAAAKKAATKSGGSKSKTTAGDGGSLRLRLMLGREIAMGPGKADLLDGIAATGSISAAGRRLGMSYKRAWLLVDTMNRCFAAPLVVGESGGKAGGGAALTALGKEVLQRFRRMQVMMAKACAADLKALQGKLRKG